MPYYKTQLEKQMKKESDDTRILVEKLYKKIGEPHKPPKKRIRVGYKGYKEEDEESDGDAEEDGILVLKGGADDEIL